MSTSNPYIVYLDTSALLKLYVQEWGSELVESAVDGAEDLVVSEISYLEARASFARLRENGEIQSDVDLGRVVNKLDEDWTEFSILPVDEPILRAAGVLAEEHRARRLRSYDALHLATTVAYGKELGTSDFFYMDHGRLSFLAFDRRLVDAAREQPGQFYLYLDPFASSETDIYKGESEEQ